MVHIFSDYDLASSPAECSQAYEFRKSQGNPDNCDEQTKLAVCVARTDGYLARPQTAADAQAFAETISTFIDTQAPNCPLDLETIADEGFEEFFDELLELLTRPESSAAAVGFSADADAGLREACIKNFAQIILNTSQVCPETVAFVKCDALAQKLDISKLPHSDVLQLQTDIENALSNYKFNCKIDLQVPAQVESLTAELALPRKIAPIVIPGCLSNTSDACQGRPDGNYSLCFPDCQSGFFITCTSSSMHLRFCPYTSYTKQGQPTQARTVYDPVKQRCDRFSTFCPSGLDK
ncbi:hypothetical protein BsWGS_25299 [Bradybaena similaris]